MPLTCINILMRLHSPYQTNGGLQCAPFCKNQLQELGLSIHSVDALWWSTTHHSDTRTLFYSFIETAMKDKTRGKKIQEKISNLTLMILAEIFYNNKKG